MLVSFNEKSVETTELFVFGTYDGSVCTTFFKGHFYIFATIVIGNNNDYSPELTANLFKYDTEGHNEGVLSMREDMPGFVFGRYGTSLCGNGILSAQVNEPVVERIFVCGPRENQ